MAAGDLLPVVDTSAGETKYITRANLAIDLAIPPADDTHDHGSSALNWRHYFMSGNFTVDTASWIGLGAAKGRIVFTDAGTDTLAILDGIVQVGTASGAGQVNITPASAISGLDIVAYTGGIGMTVTRNNNDVETSPLVTFLSSHINTEQSTLFIDHDGNGGSAAYALRVDSENTAGPTVYVTGSGILSRQDLTDTYGLKVDRNIAQAGTMPLVIFQNEHASNTQSTHFIDHDSTGGVAGYGLHVDSENAAAPAALFESAYYSATQPGIAVGDVDTGFGQNAADQLSLIAGGVEGIRITEAASVITVQFGGTLDLNENSIDLTTGLADTKYEGFTATFTAGENVTIGELCYFKPGDSKMWQADGDALATTTGLLSIATTTISADASGVFLLWGFIRDDGIFNYTAGDELYISLTPGIPTATIPPAAGDFVRLVGNAITADVIMFNPSNDILERV